MNSELTVGTEDLLIWGGLFMGCLIGRYEMCLEASRG